MDYEHLQKRNKIKCEVSNWSWSEQLAHPRLGCSSVLLRMVFCDAEMQIHKGRTSSARPGAVTAAFEEEIPADFTQRLADFLVLIISFPQGPDFQPNMFETGLFIILLPVFFLIQFLFIFPLKCLSFLSLGFNDFALSPCGRCFPPH